MFHAHVHVVLVRIEHAFVEIITEIVMFSAHLPGTRGRLQVDELGTQQRTQAALERVQGKLQTQSQRAAPAVSALPAEPSEAKAEERQTQARERALDFSWKHAADLFEGFLVPADQAVVVGERQAAT